MVVYEGNSGLTGDEGIERGEGEGGGGKGMRNGE